MSGDWIIRQAVPEDENCCASMWLKSYAHAKEVALAGLGGASVDGSADELRYWATHHPIVTSLLRSCEVRVVCDPERATYDDGPAIIWAWACLSPGVVHWVGVKRSVVRAGLAEDIVRELLGDRLESVQRTTFELCDLTKLHLVPKGWSRDRRWLAALREVSARHLDEDDLFGAVLDHVLDDEREAWAPGKERAA